jgi:DNA-binding CsgD family transcriptional regulator
MYSSAYHPVVHYEEPERGYINNDDEVDMESKSKEAQALKMFSEGKSPTQVAIRLDLAADRVRALFRDYLELEARHDLAEIYENLGTKTLFRIIRLSEICREQRMNEHDIYKALDIAKHNELQNLQWKVEFLRNEIAMLESKKNELLNLNRMIDEAQLFIAEKRGQMMENYYMNQQIII